MKTSDLFVKALENEGVEYIFGIPGEENLDFLESLRTSKIKLILTRHEQAAGFMAATYGRLTGHTGVCMSTLGPGATNLVTPAAYALLGAMPMMMITGQKPIKESKQGHFQVINIVEMMHPLTKFTKQIVNGNRVPSLVRECFRIAEEERPGPVHLEFPEDIASEDATTPIFQVSKARRPSAEAKAIQQAVSLICKAKKPLILIGAAANRRNVAKAIKRFISHTGIPFFNTQMGKGVVDERHPLFLGTAALSSNDYIHCIIDEADLIINIGHDVVEKPPFFMDLKHGRQVIHINFFSAKVDNIYFPQLEVVGDIANAVQQICDTLGKKKSWDFTHFKKVKKELEKHIQEKSNDPHFPIYPQRIVADVRKAMPSDGIITLDNGVYKIWFARNYKAHAQNTILLDNALATMGAGLPSAIAAKMVHPTKKVMAIVGDGGFMMNSQSLETAVRLKLDLVVLIIHDSAYGMIKWKQEGIGFQDFGLDFHDPDFVKYADSYGAHGHRVKNTPDLAKLLTKCINSKGVHVIDVPVDYSQNSTVLIKELKTRTCSV